MSRVASPSPSVQAHRTSASENRPRGGERSPDGFAAFLDSNGAAGERPSPAAARSSRQPERPTPTKGSESSRSSAPERTESPRKPGSAQDADSRDARASDETGPTKGSEHSDKTTAEDMKGDSGKKQDGEESAASDAADAAPTDTSDQPQVASPQPAPTADPANAVPVLTVEADVALDPTSGSEGDATAEASDALASAKAQTPVPTPGGVKDGEAPVPGAGAEGPKTDGGEAETAATAGAKATSATGDGLKMASSQTIEDPATRPAGQSVDGKPAQTQPATDAVDTQTTDRKAVAETDKDAGQRHTAPDAAAVAAKAAQAERKPEAPNPDVGVDPNAPDDATAGIRTGGDPAPNTGQAPTATAAGHASSAPASAAGGTRDAPSSTASVPLSGVAVEIAARAQAGKNRFEIRLDPPELGRIDVRLDVDREGHVTSRLVVERAETLDLLRRDASQLERALQQAGLKTSDNGLEFSLRDQSLGQRDDGRSANDRARIIVQEQDSGFIETTTHAYGRLLGRSGGIDIRV